VARTFARIRVDIWRDPEWQRLTLEAQWLFVLLLGQVGLSMAGCLITRPAVWARVADVELEQLEKWLLELEHAGLIVIDVETQELIVRKFVAHDGVLRNQNMGRAMWAAWERIESAPLRQIVIDNLPDEAWEARFCAPMPARAARRKGAPDDDS
jgi:hypothetical protein